MSYLLLAVLPASLIVAALNDIYEFKIPNWISVILIAAFPLAVVVAGAPLELIWQGFVVGFAVLVVGFILFALKVTGGGDAKLLAAAAPWFGFEAQLLYILFVGLAGGLLALAILSFRSSPILPIYARYNWLMQLHESENGLPYGVAIAAGGIFAFSEAPLFLKVFGG